MLELFRRVKRAFDPQGILSQLVGKVSIRRFDIREPSLHEVFVRTVEERDAQLEYLSSREMPVPGPGSAYSINRGLWGVTIGGTETLDSHAAIPEAAWVLSAGAFER